MPPAEFGEGTSETVAADIEYSSSAQLPSAQAWENMVLRWLHISQWACHNEASQHTTNVLPVTRLTPAYKLQALGQCIPP